MVYTELTPVATSGIQNNGLGQHVFLDVTSGPMANITLLVDQFVLELGTQCYGKEQGRLMHE